MVNTFLPFADFKKSAESLDYRRLGKQRVEAMQIINVIEDPYAKGWRHHPAVCMWRGHADALKLYSNAIVTEWISRGYKNNLKLYKVTGDPEMPWWFGKKKFHHSHRAALMRKDTDFYQDKFDVSEEYMTNGYVWPLKIGKHKCLPFTEITESSAKKK